jgi:hypothetical protein
VIDKRLRFNNEDEKKSGEGGAARKIPFRYEEALVILDKVNADDN